MSVRDRVHDNAAIGGPHAQLSPVNAWRKEIEGYLRKHQAVFRMKRNEKDERMVNPSS
jgi:hypothetical protein